MTTLTEEIVRKYLDLSGVPNGRLHPAETPFLDEYWFVQGCARWEIPITPTIKEKGEGKQLSLVEGATISEGQPPSVSLITSTGKPVAGSGTVDSVTGPLNTGASSCLTTMYLARTNGHKWSKVQLLIGVIGPIMLAQLDVVSGSSATANVGARVGSHGKTYPSSTATPKDMNKNGVENFCFTMRNTLDKEKLKKKIANPEYVDDDAVYKYADFYFIGFDLWQVKNGSIFDNVIICNDLAEADNFVKKWKALSEVEKTKKESVKLPSRACKARPAPLPSPSTMAWSTKAQSKNGNTDEDKCKAGSLNFPLTSRNNSEGGKRPPRSEGWKRQPESCLRRTDRLGRGVGVAGKGAGLPAAFPSIGSSNLSLNSRTERLGRSVGRGVGVTVKGEGQPEAFPPLGPKKASTAKAVQSPHRSVGSDGTGRGQSLANNQGSDDVGREQSLANTQGSVKLDAPEVVTASAVAAKAPTSEGSMGPGAEQSAAGDPPMSKRVSAGQSAADSKNVSAGQPAADSKTVSAGQPAADFRGVRESILRKKATEGRRVIAGQPAADASSHVASAAVRPSRAAPGMKRVSFNLKVVTSRAWLCNTSSQVDLTPQKASSDETFNTVHQANDSTSPEMANGTVVADTKVTMQVTNSQQGERSSLTAQATGSRIWGTRASTSGEQSLAGTDPSLGYLGEPQNTDVGQVAQTDTLTPTQFAGWAAKIEPDEPMDKAKPGCIDCISLQIQHLPLAAHADVNAATRVGGTTVDNAFYWLIKMSAARMYFNDDDIEVQFCTIAAIRFHKEILWIPPALPLNLAVARVTRALRGDAKEVGIQNFMHGCRNPFCTGPPWHPPKLAPSYIHEAAFGPSGRGELLRKMILEDKELGPLRQGLEKAGYPFIPPPPNALLLVRPDQYFDTSSEALKQNATSLCRAACTVAAIRLAKARTTAKRAPRPWLSCSGLARRLANSTAEEGTGALDHGDLQGWDIPLQSVVIWQRAAAERKPPPTIGDSAGKPAPVGDEEDSKEEEIVEDAQDKAKKAIFPDLPGQGVVVDDMSSVDYRTAMQSAVPIVKFQTRIASLTLTSSHRIHAVPNRQAPIPDGIGASAKVLRTVRKGPGSLGALANAGGGQPPAGAKTGFPSWAHKVGENPEGGHELITLAHPGPHLKDLARNPGKRAVPKCTGSRRLGCGVVGRESTILLARPCLRHRTLVNKVRVCVREAYICVGGCRMRSNRRLFYATCKLTANARHHIFSFCFVTVRVTRVVAVAIVTSKRIALSRSLKTSRALPLRPGTVNRR
jgi:hypothetical protein